MRAAVPKTSMGKKAGFGPVVPGWGSVSTQKPKASAPDNQNKNTVCLLTAFIYKLPFIL